MSRRRASAAVAAVAISVAYSLLLPTPSARAYPGTHVQLEGHGWGHGRGMGQYGALGYAVDHGWGYGQILDHFYGGTTVGHIGNPTVLVRLVALDDLLTIATSTGGGVTAAGWPASAVLVAQSSTPNVFHVYAGPGCGGPWGTPVATVGGPVDIFPTSGLVHACSTGRAYRGHLRATRDSGGPQRTVNVVDMEGYLRGVVPRESPASWGSLDGGSGMEALKAQAVAARSYAASEARYTYAHTCDTTSCQVYGGYSLNGTLLEHANTNAAIDATASEVRRWASSGAVARTEFSSSTGGYSKPGAFPAVPDAGDAVSLNPNHTWTTSVAVSSIEAAYPSIGALVSVRVTERNGLGDWGGRATKVLVHGASGSVTVTGDAFRSALGLKSDWFRVVGTPSGGIAGYWVLDDLGGVFSFGSAQFYGSVPGLRNAGHPIGPARVVAMAATTSGHGYWALDHVGGMFAFGDAPFFGSIPALRAAGQPIGLADVITMAPSASGGGYWMLDAAGGMFAFGNAGFFGSVPGLRQAGHHIGAARMVGMAPTPSGNGYWLVDEFGGVFAFGDAPFFGSIPALRQAGHAIGPALVVAIVGTASGNGYWVLDDKGGLFAFGDAQYYGSAPGIGYLGRAADLAPTATGQGYLILMVSGGTVLSFGDAPVFGGVQDVTGLPVQGVAIATVRE